MTKNSTVKKKGRRQQRQATHQRQQRLRWVRIGGLIVLALAALAVFGFYRVSSAPQVDAPAEIMAANVDGPAEAPVRIVEFGDFGCPSCRAWHNSGITEQLKAEFGDQINFTFRHFPVITRQSPKAAEAGQCAAEQNRFWDFHDFIYEQTPQNALSIDQLNSYAATLGLDTDEFSQCLESGKYRSYVARDQEAALAAGARGTPTFFINGKQSSFSYQGMAATIQQELAAN
jgi:protein-disulfide isomerase